MDKLDNDRVRLSRHMQAMEERLLERIDLRMETMADQVTCELHKALAAQAHFLVFVMGGVFASIAALGFAAMP